MVKQTQKKREIKLERKDRKKEKDRDRNIKRNGDRKWNKTERIKNLNYKEKRKKNRQ